MRTAVILCMLCLALAAAEAEDAASAAAPDAAAPSPAGSDTAQSGAGTGSTKPDLSVPKDTATQWVVGVCAFPAAGLSAENVYLASSLPLMLRNQVSPLGDHQFSTEEIGRIRGLLIARELSAVEKSITDVCRERDALLFDRVPEGDASRTTVQARLAAVVARRAFLRALDPAGITITAHKTVSFKEGTGPGKLLDPPTVPLDIYCARLGIDLLIGGTIQEEQGYLLLDLWAFDAAAGKTVFTDRNAAQRDELYSSLPRFGREVAATILGRPWSLVAFAPDPPQSTLRVDGTLVASGASPALYLSPGTHEISISAPGYRETTRSVTLEPAGEARIADSLDRATAGSVSITSEPTGADLYVNSMWKGKTPLSLEKPPTRSRGVLSLDGFYDASFSLDPASPANLSFSLVKDTGARDVLQKKAREDVYFSLACFALSVPLPLFTYALAIDFAVRQVDYTNQGMSSAAARAGATSTALQGAYYVGIGVSAALFTWMLTRIVHYVTVSNQLAG